MDKENIKKHRYLFSNTDALFADKEGDPGSQCFCDPEGMPYTDSTKNAAEDKGSRKNQKQISAERNNEGSSSLSQSLQCTTGCNGYRGNQKTCTDDPKSCFSCLDRGWICGKHPHELSRNSQADDGSDQHDHTTHTECDVVDLFYTFMFSGSIVISDYRTHSLYDPTCRKIQEGLQFVVDSENHNIDRRTGSKKPVQSRNQDRWKCEIQGTGDTDRV